MNLAAVKQRLEDIAASLDVKDEEVHDCDALLVKIQDAEIKLTLALAQFDCVLAVQPTQ